MAERPVYVICFRSSNGCISKHVRIRPGTIEREANDGVEDSRACPAPRGPRHSAPTYAARGTPVSRERTGTLTGHVCFGATIEAHLRRAASTFRRLTLT